MSIELNLESTTFHFVEKEHVGGVQVVAHQFWNWAVKLVTATPPDFMSAKLFTSIYNSQNSFLVWV